MLERYEKSRGVFTLSVQCLPPSGACSHPSATATLHECNRVRHSSGVKKPGAIICLNELFHLGSRKGWTLLLGIIAHFPAVGFSSSRAAVLAVLVARQPSLCKLHGVLIELLEAV